MNDKDKEAFEKWFLGLDTSHITSAMKLNRGWFEAWQAACEYKKLEYKAQIEALEIAYKSNQEAALMSAILSDKNRCLKAENKKLHEALEFFADKIGWKYDIAREALKEKPIE